MTYDKCTNTIVVMPGSDFTVGSGVFFMETLKQMGEKQNTSLQTQESWRVVEKWLDCEDRNLTQQDHAKIGAAWRAYVAIGLAPSDALQPTFDKLAAHYKKQGKNYSKDKPPTEVMSVFDRCLAADEEIKNKREKDWTEERTRWKTIAKQYVSKTNQGSWWRRQSHEIRLWLFGCAIWVFAVWAFIVIFDPFDTSGWEYIGDALPRVFLLMVVPLIGGAIKWMYKKFVE